MGKSSKHKRHSDSDSEEDKQEKKKSAKKVAKVAKMLGYSNDINPFGDSNLLTPFIWGKKKEEQAEQKKSHKKDKKKKSRKRKHKNSSDSSSSSSTDGEGADDEEDQRLSLLSEIEKVRKRREDREAELAELERLREEEQRLREMASFGDWQRKEEEFHLEQVVERSKVRLLEHRGRYLDRIVQNVLLLHTAEKVLQTHTQYAKTHKGQLNIHIHAPRDVDFLYVEYENKSAYEIVKHIYMVDTLEQIVKDIEQFEELDHERYQNRFSGFYTAVKVVINMCKRNIQADTASSLHTSIVTEVKDMLVQKSTQELDTLENEIRERLQSGQGVVDVVYWETLLDEIVYQRALKFLQTTHEDIRNQLDTVIYELEREGVLTSEMRLQKQNELEEYMRIHHPTQPTHLSLDDVVVQQYLQEHAEMEMQEEEDAAKRQTEVHMGAKDEVPILPVHPTTHAQPMDKYHPRKPRYFNRVRTGWDRTKYNLSHYDYDNPPPKVIQGYKFTIFYPDLIDKTITPRYHLEPCADGENNEFVIIRFTAGPPYEDIAFKILNKEWDKHPRAGFLRVFDRGVLQVNFNFKRVFYRR